MKKKILVVDDEQQIINAIQRRLQAHDYEVISANDGIEALEKVALETPDLILLDILMPRMDGSTFLHRMKQKNLIGKIPVIVLTAKANMREFFLIDGVVDFIAKPFEAKNLLAEIERHLNKTKFRNPQV